MLPSRYRGRYSLFIFLSLLIHLSIVVAIFWSVKNEQQEKMQDKTVTVTLKQKEESKKEEPKKEEPKKEEAKKEEPKKAEPKKAEPITRPIIRDSLSEYQTEASKEPEQSAALARLGSMEVIDEKTLSQLVVSTQNLDRKFDTRHFEGEVYKQELNFFQRQEFNAAMQQALIEIDANIVPVEWDGGRYYGEINFFVDNDGTIEKIVLKKTSGSDALDKSMIQGLIKTKRITMPVDPQVRKVMHLTKKLLYYSDKDMLR